MSGHGRLLQKHVLIRRSLDPVEVLQILKAHVPRSCRLLLLLVLPWEEAACYGRSGARQFLKGLAYTIGTANLQRAEGGGGGWGLLCSSKGRRVGAVVIVLIIDDLFIGVDCGAQ